MDKSLPIFALAIIIVGVLVLLAMKFTSKHKFRLDREEYQIAFLSIENSLKRENEASYSLAIIKGDKLLDKAMCELGISGRTMGDRLKKIGKERFSQLNAVWHAHKLRNQIAHEADFAPTFMQAQHALATYKQALKDLGAI